MQKGIIFAVIAGSASASIHPSDYYEGRFFDWMQEHKIQFRNGTEFANRLVIFADNLDFIEEHNVKKSTFKLGTNAYSHMTHEEFMNYFHIGSLRPPLLRSGAEFVHIAPKDMASVPVSIDWSEISNVVTPVKNQGNCGSCWAFSATGSIEGAYGIKYNSQPSPNGFSEQSMVSCDSIDSGCNGGLMDNAFSFVQTQGGLPSETDYPYTSGDTGSKAS